MSGIIGRKRRSRSASEYPTRRGLGKVARFSSGRNSAAATSSIRQRSTRSRSAKPRRRLLDGVNQERLARILTIGAFAVVGIVGLVLIIVSANSGGKELETSIIESDNSGNVITAEDSGATLTLAFGGSLKLQNDIVTAAKIGDSYDFNNYLSELGQVMSADVSIVNVLGTVDAKGDGSALAGYPTPNYPAQLAPALRNIGVNHAVLANSTTLQNGFGGMTSTIDTLASNDITTLGAYKNADTGSTVYVKRVNSITIGIGAYNCLTNAAYTDLINSQLAVGVTADQLSYCINQVDYTINRTVSGAGHSPASDVIKSDVAAMRDAGAQFVIICLNWGSASTTTPTGEMGTLAQRLIDIGVDVTVGYGSDVVQKVTVKNHADSNGTKKCYVFYSLGNLLADCDSGTTAEKQASMVVNMTVEREAGSDSVKLSSATYHPIYVNHDSQYETENTHLKYRSLPAAKYYYAESLPDVFSNNAQWSASKRAFDRVKSIVGNNLQPGVLTSSASNSSSVVDAGDVGGSQTL